MPNINIVYKVNKSELEASTAAVNQAKSATDQLTASAAKLGQQGSKNASTYASSIASARVKVDELRRQIELANQADTKRVSGLVAQWKAAKAQLDQYTQSLKSNATATNNAAKGGNSLASSFNNIYSAVKLIIGAQIAKQFISMTLEASALAGKVEGVEKAFKRAFPDGVLVLNDLRKATKGTITDFELMQRTLQATNLGVGLKELPVLFEFAAARAQQTGESVDYLVDSIVRGIGRKSPLILDNLGLSAIRLKEQFNGASLASQSVADVTAAVGRIAKEELEKMGGFAGNAAVKVDQLKVSWEGLKLQLAKFFQDGALVSYFNELIKKASDFVEIQRRGITAEKLYAERAIQSAAIKSVETIKQEEFNESNEIYLENIQNVIKEKAHELILTQKLIKFNKDNEIEIYKNIHAENISFQEKKKLIAVAKERFSQQEKQRLLYIDEIKLLNGVAEALRKNSSKSIDSAQVETLETLRQKVKDLNEQIEDTPVAELKTMKALESQVKATEKRISKIISDLHFLGMQEPTINVKLKVVSASDDLEKGTPLADKGLVPSEITALLNSGSKDISPQLKKSTEAANDYKKALDDLIKKIPELVPATKYTVDQLEEQVDATELFLARMRNVLAKNQDEITSHGIDIANDQIQSIISAEASAYDIRIKKTQEFYDTQILLAGDNDKAKQRLRLEEDKKIKQLEKQRADREKKAAQAGILVNTALGIIKAIATAATIYDGLIEAAGVAAEGASQYIIASRANYYAKGVIDLKGPGTGTSDSIPSMLSRGESVMTAKETQDSNKTLKAIRAKKLNDKVLDRIMNQAKSGGGVVGFDDTRLLAATKAVERAAKGNDIVRKGSIIYDAKIEGDNMKTYIRSKSLN